MPRTILYVDDDVALARLAERHLGRAGYDVIAAVDGASAMVAFEKGGIDAIVLDHYLRTETGMDIFHRLQECGCSAPVIYITGSSDATIAIEAMKNGAADYVIKTVGDEFWPLMQNAIGQAISNADLRREKEKADQEIRIGKERAEILLAEVNHRVANSLALVAALIRLQAGSSKNEDVKEALAETQARITAIAGMHRSLYTSDDVRHVEMDKYLGTLVNEVQGTVSDRQRPSIRLAADEVVLTSDRAVSVGMIVTELLTNALKYAYEPGAEGEVRVFLTRQPNGKALLAVEDDGIGWKEGDIVKGTGLGSRIVKSMASTLGSAIQYVERPKGTRAEMTIDLSV